MFTEAGADMFFMPKTALVVYIMSLLIDVQCAFFVLLDQFYPYVVYKFFLTFLNLRKPHLDYSVSILFVIFLIILLK